MFNKRETYHIVIFLLCFGIMWWLSHVECQKCGTRTVSPQAKALLAQAQTGDIILVRSPDFFSKTITDLSGCDFSGIKMVYRQGDDVQLIISDTGALGDISNGLEIEPADDFFAGYQYVSLSLIRPLHKTAEHMQNIEYLSERARNSQSGKQPIEYDLAFDNTSMEKMTCQKIVIAVYGDYVMDRAREKTWLYGSTFPCDLHMQNVQKIGQWVDYWQPNSASNL